MVLAAIGAATLLSALWRQAALRWGWLDHSGERSMHEGAIPRGGGVAIAAAIVFAAGAFTEGYELGARGTAVVAGGLLMLLVGLYDDRFGVRAGVRLLLQALASAAVLLVSPLPAAALPIALLWMLAVVNFYNFLDGIDG